MAAARKGPEPEEGSVEGDKSGKAAVREAGMGRVPDAAEAGKDWVQAAGPAGLADRAQVRVERVQVQAGRAPEESAPEEPATAEGRARESESEEAESA